MKNKMSLLLSLLVILLCWSPPCLCQELSGKAKDLLEREKAKEDVIRFYGKIIDQCGQPVDGAIVSIHIGRPHIIPQGPQILQTVSDAKGLFQIPSEEDKIIKGGGLIVNDIQKEGYEVRFDWGVEGHQGAEYLKNSANRHNPDKATPVIFHMRKKNPVSVFLFKDSHLELRIDASESGSTLAYDFLRKNKLKSRGDMETKTNGQFGDLKLNATLNTNDMFWTVTLASVGRGCGILATNQMLYDAPQTGYQTNCTFIARDHKTPETKHLYVQSREPTIYTRVDITYVNANAEFFRISANVATNPYGDRNLEHDTRGEANWRVEDELRTEAVKAFSIGKLPEKPDIPKRVKEANEKRDKEKAEKEQAKR